MRPTESKRRRVTTLKRMFEVRVASAAPSPDGSDTLIAIADDERDLKSLAELRTADVLRLVALPGLVSAVGPSRIIGSTAEA